MPGQRSPLLLAALAVLGVITVGVQARLSWQILDRQLHVTERARVPFSLRTPAGRLAGLEAEAEDAGLKGGDRLLRLEGVPVRGSAGPFDAGRGKRPGDSLTVEAQRDGAPLRAVIKLHAERDQPLSVRDWVLAGFLDYLTPWFCLALGFAVAFLRPRDLLAWLLLALMLSFSQVAQAEPVRSAVLDWNGWPRVCGSFYQAFWNGTWGLWMMLFGQYFPDRRADRLRDRLTRWLLGVPLLALTVLVAGINAAVLEDYSGMSGFQRALLRFGGLITLLEMLAISTFFISIFMKMSYATSPDARRRLRLLYGGATAALTPLFLLVIWSFVWRRSIDDLPDWLLIPSLVALFLFPFTLAYVIVVEKAMELRVAIRQGLQYALATRGLRVLQVVIYAVVLTVVLRMASEPTVRLTQRMIMLGLAIVFVVRSRQGVEALRRWIDRRFFREAVNTERVLSDLGDNVRTIVETQPLLETVAGSISSALHVQRVAALVASNGDFLPAYTLGFDAAAPMVRFSKSGAVAVELARTREPLRVSLTNPEPWVESEQARLEQLSTELLLPLAVKNRLLGFLSLGPKRSEEPYTATDLHLLQSVAMQTGLALENTRLTAAVADEVAQRERLNRELEIAREVQQRLFPQSGPQIDGLEYAGACRPASSVGGDYYDFVATCDGRLGIAIGDISGKGVPAALLMASLQASLRGLAISNPPALDTLMTNLNHLIFDASPSNRYATFFYGVYDPRTRDFIYVNGGHNPPMVFRGAEVIRLEDGGPVVGLFGPAQYVQASIRLQSGDTLLMFTDGVSEAMNAADEEFGEEMMIAAVRSAPALHSDALIAHLMSAADAFAAGAPQHDDMTLVVARVE